MASGATNKGIYEILSGGTDLLTSTIKATLIGTGWTPNKDDNFLSAITANELTGLTRQTIGSKTVTEDDASDVTDFDGGDITFTAVPSSQTAAWVAIFRDTGVDATSPIIGWIDIPNTPTNGGDITIEWAPNRIIRGS